MATYLKDTAYNTLREKIINCEYEPGSFINEAVLISTLNISRTPIRDALNRLAAENFITILPKKGILVKKISLDEILEVYEARMVIEPALIEKYGSKFKTDEIESFIQRCIADTNIDEMVALDKEFHSKVYSLCENPYLQNLMITLDGHVHRNRIWRNRQTLVKDSNAEHLAILQALLVKDYPAAREAMSAHLQNARNRAIAKYM